MLFLGSAFFAASRGRGALFPACRRQRRRARPDDRGERPGVRAGGAAAQA